MNLPSSKNWKATTLDRVIDLIGGGTPKTTVDEYWNGNIPWLSVVDFNNDSRWVYDADKKITQEGLDNSSTKLLEKGDIIISARGTVGAMAQLAKPMAFNQSCYGVRVKEGNDQNFLFYLLKSSMPKLVKNVHGAVFDTLTRESFSHVEVFIPDSTEDQRSIAALLGSLDDKIELLRTENGTLERMAQAIFKEWFVDFRFPGATGVMVDSELGKIPKGWRVFNLSEIVNLINGYSYKGIELKDSGRETLVTLKSFDRNGGFQTRGFKPFEGKPKPEQEVKIGDLIVAHTDLTQDAEVLGNPAFIFEDDGFEKMYITMDLVKVTSKFKEIKNSFLYFLMKTREFKSHCIGYSNGTTVLHLSKRAIPEYRAVLPIDMKLCNQFSLLTKQMMDKVSNNIIEIKTLSISRDNLLGKIFSK